MVEQSKWNGRQFTKSGRWKWLLLVVIVAGGIVIAGRVASDQGSGPSTSGVCNDKLTQMEHSGTMAKMLQQHQSMMEPMRAGLSPQMQQPMDADPMWKLMRSGDFTTMMEDQQQQIDRMLGSPSACGAP